MSNEKEIAETNKVMVFKLVTGEEVIGKIVDMKDTAIGIENTLQIGYQDNGKGGMGFGFMPWGPLVVGVKYINANHVVYVSAPRDELLSAFNQATSQIVVPAKQLITG